MTTQPHNVQSDVRQDVPSVSHEVDLTPQFAAHISDTPLDTDFSPAAESSIEYSTTPPTTYATALFQSTIASPGTLIFSGASLLAFVNGQQLSGCMFGAIMLLAAYNRFRVYLGYNDSEKNDSVSVTDSIKSLVKSPTIDFRGSSVYFSLAAVEAAVNFNPLALAYIIYGRGEYLAGCLQERKLSRQQSQPDATRPPQVTHEYPNFSHPVIYFAAGNLLVNVLNGAASNITTIPALLACAGTVIYGLFGNRDKAAHPGGNAFRIHSISQLLFGLSNLFSLDFGRAAVFLLWTPTAMMQAQDMDNERKIGQGANSGRNEDRLSKE